MATSPFHSSSKEETLPKKAYPRTSHAYKRPNFNSAAKKSNGSTSRKGVPSQGSSGICKSDVWKTNIGPSGHVKALGESIWRGRLRPLRHRMPLPPQASCDDHTATAGHLLDAIDKNHNKKLPNNQENHHALMLNKGDAADKEVVLAEETVATKQYRIPDLNYPPPTDD